MRILILIPYFLPGSKYGGPVKSIKNFIKHFRQLNIRIMTSASDFGETEVYDEVTIGKWQQEQQYEVFYSRILFFDILKNVFQQQNDVIYINSFFFWRQVLPILLANYLAVTKSNFTILIAPRGELSEAALSMKCIRKKVYIYFISILMRRDNIYCQATSQKEVSEIIKKLGVNQRKILHAMNYTEIQIVDEIKPISNDHTLRIVFVSRINRKKNLKFAMSVMTKLNFSAKLDIYGYIEDPQYWEECLDVIKDLPQNVSVNYMGSLEPEAVVPKLREYEVFLFPTLGENYGHVMVEALMAGNYILTSKNTPWNQLEELNFGKNEGLELSAFVNALDAFYYSLRGHWRPDKDLVRALLIEQNKTVTGQFNTFFDGLEIKRVD